MILFYNSVVILFEVIRFCIVIRILISMLGIYSQNMFTRIIYQITEPFLSMGRSILEMFNIQTVMFDFSPVVAVLIMQIIESILRRIILL